MKRRTANTVRSARQGAVLQRKTKQGRRRKRFRELLAVHRVVKEVCSKEAKFEQKMKQIRKSVMGISRRLFWAKEQPVYTASRQKAWRV